MNWRPRSRQKCSLVKSDVVIAQGAAREADRRLEETKDQWSRVKAMADTLVLMREENHFAERIRTAILGGQ